MGVSGDEYLTEQQMLGTSLPGVQLQLCTHTEDLIKGRCALRHQKEEDDIAGQLHLNDAISPLIRATTDRAGCFVPSRRGVKCSAFMLSFSSLQWALLFSLLYRWGN